MKRIKRAINPVPKPNIIGTTIPFMFPKNNVITTKTRIINSNSLGNFIFVEVFKISGVKVKIRRNKFVEAMCHKWLFIEVIIESIKISLIIIERY